MIRLYGVTVAPKNHQLRQLVRSSPTTKMHDGKSLLIRFGISYCIQTADLLVRTTARLSCQSTTTALTRAKAMLIICRQCANTISNFVYLQVIYMATASRPVCVAMVDPVSHDSQTPPNATKKITQQVITNQSHVPRTSTQDSRTEQDKRFSVEVS
jgi:hypothetical protein